MMWKYKSSRKHWRRAKGVELIDRLVKVTDWSCLKPHYTSELVKLDESLNRHLQFLEVRVGVDVKKGLVVVKETSQDVKEGLVVVKETSKDVKEGLAVVAETSKDVKEGLAGLGAKLSYFNDFMKEWDFIKFRARGLGYKVESLSEAALLGISMEELAAATEEVVELVANKRRDVFGAVFGATFKRLSDRTRRIFELIETKRTENKEMSYFPTEELKYYRVKIEEGVKAVLSSGEIDETCWTEELKAEYKNKFLDLEKSLERLHDRLSELHPFKWNTGKCGGSCGSGATSMTDSAISNNPLGTNV